MQNGGKTLFELFFSLFGEAERIDRSAEVDDLARVQAELPGNFINVAAVNFVQQKFPSPQRAHILFIPGQSQRPLRLNIKNLTTSRKLLPRPR